MPTYDFRCPEGHDFELFLRTTARARVKCPECGRLATRRISGGAGLLFKGSGFYITDYGRDGKGPRKAADEGGAAKAEPPKADAPAVKQASAGKKAAE